MPNGAIGVFSPRFPRGGATARVPAGSHPRKASAGVAPPNVQTTAIYTHVDTRDLARVVTKAHPRERAWKRRKKTPGQ